MIADTAVKERDALGAARVQALENALEVLRQQLAEVEAALEARQHDLLAQKDVADDAAMRAETAETTASDLEAETERLGAQVAQMQVRTEQTLHQDGPGSDQSTAWSESATMQVMYTALSPWLVL